MPSPPQGGALRRAVNPTLVLVLVCFAQFMVVLDATITNVALPSIKRDLGFSPADLQWVVNGYGLLFGGLLLLGGRAADLFGRKRLFLVGVSLFTLASLVCGLSGSPEMLIAARAVQGLGAALVSPAALSIITTTYAEGPERARALGVWGAIAGGGGAVGLLLGGFLTDQFSWEWNFLVNVPVGIGVALAAARHIPESRSEARSRGFDLPGAVLATVGLVALTFAIVRSSSWGFGDARTIGIGAGALGVLALFGLVELRHSDPLVRLGILRVRTLAVANLSMFLVVGGLFAFFFFGVLYLQQVHGYDALESGIAFLPMTGGIIVGSVLAQHLIRRFGVKAVLLGGLASATAGMAWMTTLSPSDSYVTGLLPGLVLLAFGMGNAFVPLTLTATAGLDAADQGLASGLFNTSQQVGAALGLAVLSTVASNVTADHLAFTPRPVALVDGFTTAFTVGAVLILAGGVVALLGLRRRDVPAGAGLEEVVPVAA